MKALHRDLHIELTPETVLQMFLFNVIVACMGRCLLALRVEIDYLAKIADIDPELTSRLDLHSGLAGRFPRTDRLGMNI